MLDDPDQQTIIGIRGDDCRASFASLCPTTFPIKNQSTFHLAAAMRMTTVATMGQHRNNLGMKEVFVCIISQAMGAKKPRGYNARAEYDKLRKHNALLW
jgi:hypothetical protein